MAIIKSLELPDDVPYKLTKVASLNKNSMFIKVDNFVVGTLITNPINLEERCSVQGSRLYDSISTSFVKKIKLQKNKVVLTTENSIYELVEVNEPKDP